MTQSLLQGADAGNLDLADLNLQIDNLDLPFSKKQAAQALAEKTSCIDAKSIDDAVDN